MIDAKELRIGNYVSDIYASDTFYAKITSIASDWVFYGEFYRPPNYLKPIPITEEWLLRFGATQYAEGRFYLEINNKLKLAFNLGEDFFVCELFSKKNHFCYFNDKIFVHQLQNLYFALTGQELELKE